MESDMGDSEEGEAEHSEEVEKRLSGKKMLRSKIDEEKVIRAKEAGMRSVDGVKPKNINDFERLLVADSDQSYLWIQYIAFVLEKVNIEGARKIAERAVKAVSLVADNDKLNLWIAYMNLES
jgi:rRNA biogenesis protein RRP5